MSNPIDVHWFSSEMTGAPTCSGESGKLIAILDACLINGFGSVTLDSLVVASGVATGTLSSGHGFTDHIVALVEGATPSGLNGEKRITVTSSTTFTFDATGISDQTATGTITAKVAPVGWTKTYSGTNKAVYARTAVSATAMLLRVDDSPAQYPTLIMYETMSDVDTGTGPAPTSGSYYTAKSNAASTATRPWRLYADDKALYIYIDTGANGNYNSGFYFGDINSFKSNDTYHCALIAHPTASVNYAYQARLDTTTGSLIARSYTQTGAAITFTRYSHYLSGVTVGLAKAGGAYPSAVDNCFRAWPVDAWETSTVPRGMMPGLWNPLHTNNPDDATIITDIPQLAGRNLFIQKAMDGTYRCGMDITGPWR